MLSESDLLCTLVFNFAFIYIFMHIITECLLFIMSHFSVTKHRSAIYWRGKGVFWFSDNFVFCQHPPSRYIVRVLFPKRRPVWILVMVISYSWHYLIVLYRLILHTKLQQRRYTVYSLNIWTTQQNIRHICVLTQKRLRIDLVQDFAVEQAGHSPNAKSAAPSPNCCWRWTCQRVGSHMTFVFF